MDDCVNFSDFIRNCEVVNYHLLFWVPVLTENTRIIWEHITRHCLKVGHDLVARCFAQKEVTGCIFLTLLINSGNLVQVGVIKHIKAFRYLVHQCALGQGGNKGVSN